jgi:hypothetical protein
MPLALKMFKAEKLKLFPTFGKAESQEEGRRRTTTTTMIHEQA